MKKLSKFSNKDEIRNFFKKLTDEDFNDNNGEEYFVKNNNKEDSNLISKLDAYMNEF